MKLFGKKEKDRSPDKGNMPKIKKSFSWRLPMLIMSGIIAILGFGMFVNYFLTQNMAFGAPSIFMVAGGAFAFKYFWSHTEDVTTEHIGEVATAQVNSLCIYQDRIIFEDVHKPEGYPWECMNDHKKYYVNIFDVAARRLVPFTLPDTQYYDPTVFAERVLALPAHRKIFRQKEKLFQKLKTAMLVFGILIVWLLIMTTSGS